MLRRSLGLTHCATRCIPFLAVRSERRCVLTLAIETSCDDTCVALLEYDKDGLLKYKDEDGRRQGRLHFHEKVTLPNTGKGGIHPAEAANSHRENLGRLIAQAMRPAASDRLGRLPDFISVTRGPGMHGSLCCGLDTAKGLAAAWNIPLLGVHHMQAHALTPRLLHVLEQPMKTEDPIKPSFPFLTLLVSGGHTMLLHSCSLTDHKILADTMDIAIGDCLDKCGRSILPDSIRSKTADTAYGKHLSAYAFPDASTFSAYSVPAKRRDEIGKPQNEFGWQIQSPLNESRKLAFSYAGFVSGVDRIVASMPNISDAERLALARTALGAAFEHLCSRTTMALESLREQDITVPTLVVSGGVAANDFLRYFLRKMLDARGFRDLELVFPPVRYSGAAPFFPCTDNAAMIAWAGMEMFMAGWRSPMGIIAKPQWSMDSKVDGGILGVSAYLQQPGEDELNHIHKRGIETEAEFDDVEDFEDSRPISSPPEEPHLEKVLDAAGKNWRLFESQIRHIARKRGHALHQGGMRHQRYTHHFDVDPDEGHNADSFDDPDDNEFDDPPNAIAAKPFTDEPADQSPREIKKTPSSTKYSSKERKTVRFKLGRPQQPPAEEWVPSQDTKRRPDRRTNTRS